MIPMRGAGRYYQIADHDHPERVEIRKARENIEHDFKTGVIDEARYRLEMKIMDDGERQLNARIPRK
jgi:hypothetical protein